VHRLWLLPWLLLPTACSGNEGPTLVLQCQDGRVAAYMVTGTAEQIATGALLDDAVEVRLDSAPECSMSAP
jgi:hypothetical protein